MTLPRAVTRSIDRLARRAHAFHRFAHHPLCDAYRGELIALRGRARICRGCSYALSGAVAGACAGLVLELPVVPLSALTAVCIASQWRSWWRREELALAQPAIRVASVAAAAIDRPSKLWTRAVPAFACGATLAGCVRGVGPAELAIGLSLIALLALTLGRYRLQRPDRTACLRCPEYDRPSPCSGYREIVRAERAFVRRAQRLIDDASSQIAAMP